MYCEKCGNQVSEYSSFCKNCGNALTNETKQEVVKNVDKNEVLLELKPTTNIKFFFQLEFIEKTLIMLFLIPIGLLMFLLAMFCMGQQLNTPEILERYLYIYAGIGILCLLIGYAWGFIKAHLRKKQYEEITYRFYSDRVVYIDPFLNKTHKELKYKNIREISKNEGPLQRIYKVGNISFVTNAEGGEGISVCDIENVDECYKKVKEIIEV